VAGDAEREDPFRVPRKPEAEDHHRQLYEQRFRNRGAELDAR
jgi:hypothetical protein